MDTYSWTTGREVHRPVHPTKHRHVKQRQEEGFKKLKKRVLPDFTLTAYSLDVRSTGKRPGMPGFGVTASGTKADTSRTIAVDPRVIPLGTPVYIDGIGWRMAEDTGGAVRGRHIDVLLPSESQAIRFGVKQHIRVYVPALGNPVSAEQDKQPRHS